MSALEHVSTDALLQAVREAREWPDDVTAEDLSIQLGIDLSALTELTYLDLPIFSQPAKKIIMGPGFEVIPPIIRELVHRGESQNGIGRAVGAAGPTIGNWLRWERSNDDRTNWQRDVIPRAREWVQSQSAGATLRQLFYRLVVERLISNVDGDYKYLSRLTAQARREGTFPEFLDRTSDIERPTFFDSPGDAHEFIKNVYRRDRTEGQPFTIILGVEKAGISAQLDQWFTNSLGVPHIAPGGFTTQTLVKKIQNLIDSYDRPAVLIYAGDFDPSGMYIYDDLVNRVGRFDFTHRVALNEEQVDELPENILDADELEKLENDPRASYFIEQFGDLRQVEVDALDPNDLRELYDSTLQEYWNADAYEAVVEREDEEREVL